MSCDGGGCPALCGFLSPTTGPSLKTDAVGHGTWCGLVSVAVLNCQVGVLVAQAKLFLTGLSPGSSQPETSSRGVSCPSWCLILLWLHSQVLPVSFHLRRAVALHGAKALAEPSVLTWTEGALAACWAARRLVLGLIFTSWGKPTQALPTSKGGRRGDTSY